MTTKRYYEVTCQGSLGLTQTKYWETDKEGLDETVRRDIIAFLLNNGFPVKRIRPLTETEYQECT